MTTGVTETENAVAQQFLGKVSDLVLRAPNTTFGPQLEHNGPVMHSTVVRYLARNILDRPWTDSLVLLAAIMSMRRLDPRTIVCKVGMIHARFKAFSTSVPFQTVQNWDVDRHLPAYLQGAYTTDSDYVRYEFQVVYRAGAKAMKHWWDTLSEADQSQYKSFLLPIPTPELIEHLSLGKVVIRAQREKRKLQTDAVVPRFHELRALAHLRFNLLDRILQSYYRGLAHMQTCAEQGNPVAYPFEFALDEGGSPSDGLRHTERLHFRIWDRVSFVLAHAQHYTPQSLWQARRPGLPSAFPEQYNHVFVEYIGVERLHDNAPPEGLWCADLIQRGLLGSKPRVSQENADWLRSWGYGSGCGTYIGAFSSANRGVITWDSVTSKFMNKARPLAEGVLLPLEELHAAALFGLLAIDIFSTTGMRENEALQIHLTPDCLVRHVLPPPPGARVQSPSIRYALRLLPKGERKAQLHDYFVSKETVRLMDKVARFLCQSYGVAFADEIPAVPFNPAHERAHRFGPAPYLFQCQGKHLSARTLRSCLHLLVHGMVLRTQTGEPVVVKPHYLRHVFATHAVQIEKIPVDIVGIWLKQKNVDVTNYYSQPTFSMVAEAADRFLMRVAAHIDVADVIRRSPQELQQILVEARGKVGVLANVLGGECTCAGFCPVQFSCPGCPAHVPDPDKRSQLVQFIIWSRQREVYAEEEGLYPEAERMRQAIRYAEVELAEMDAIEAYRKDEERDITLHFDQ